MPHRANSSTRHGHTMMPRKMVGGTLTMFDSRSSLPILRAWSVQDGTKNGTDHLDHTHAPRTSTHLLRKCPLFKMMQSATCLCLQVRLTLLTLLCRYDSAPINMHAEMLSE